MARCTWACKRGKNHRGETYTNAIITNNVVSCHLILSPGKGVGTLYYTPERALSSLMSLSLSLSDYKEGGKIVAVEIEGIRLQKQSIDDVPVWLAKVEQVVVKKAIYNA